MNSLLIGHLSPEHFLEKAKPPFLLIDDGPIADAFLARFPARVFDVSKHSFNPMKGINYQRARSLVSILYAAYPEGESTLTVRNGKRALLKMLLQNAQRLDRLKGDEEAVAMVNDLLLSPVLKKVLCNPTNFSFKGAVVVRLDRSKLGDFDCFLLASLLIGQAKGQIIVPDFGFYGRDFHFPLIRQNRLVAGLAFLEEVPAKLQKALLLIKDKEAHSCIWEDAMTLAKYQGLTPGVGSHTAFIEGAMA